MTLKQLAGLINGWLSILALVGVWQATHSVWALFWVVIASIRVTLDSDT